MGFQEIFSVRGEFGYWVLGTDEDQPAQRPAGTTERKTEGYHNRYALSLALLGG